MTTFEAFLLNLEVLTISQQSFNDSVFQGRFKRNLGYSFSNYFKNNFENYF